MNGIVNEWYETKKNVDEMMHWEKPTLKKWESDAVKLFPSRARILDIGCGLGREAFVLTDMGFEVTGIDISQEVINQVVQLSEQKGYNISFLLYDGYSLPFEETTFDVVIIWAQTLGIMYGDKYKTEILSECRHVLVNDGLISFSGHNYEFLIKNYPNCVKDRRFYPYADTELYWETFEADDLTRIAGDNGFEVTVSGKGEIYKPEDGTVLYCVCKKE